MHPARERRRTCGYGRSDLGDALRKARHQPAAKSAWTLRGALNQAYSELDSFSAETSIAMTKDASSSNRVIFNFESENDIDAWRPLNDTVMGGRSRSAMDPGEGSVAVFSGTMSMENNDGFASVRAPIDPASFANATAVELRVRGDGRSYRLLVSEDRSPIRGSYDMDFDTTAGAWTTARIPLTDMRLNVMGRRPDTWPVIAENIVSIGIPLGDKREGTFQLEIDSIQAAR